MPIDVEVEVVPMLGSSAVRVRCRDAQGSVQVAWWSVSFTQASAFKDALARAAASADSFEALIAAAGRPPDAMTRSRAPRRSDDA